MDENWMNDNEMKQIERERFALAMERMAEIVNERICTDEVCAYFHSLANFVLFMKETWELVESKKLFEMSLDELKAHNRALYEDILLPHYDKSFANPDVTAKVFGRELGQMMAFLCAEVRGMIAAAYEQKMSSMVIRAELLLEIYQVFVCAKTEEEQDLPDVRNVQQIIYWYVSDYYEPESMERTGSLADPSYDFAVKIITECDLKDLRYLYYYGEYVTENELATAKHLNEMSEDQVALMADTYTEGYRIGFEVGNKDITIKDTVNIRYALGFERMMKRAVKNFEKMGLKTTAYRAGSNIFQGRSVDKNGFFGANPNKQFDYDHKEDQALVLDKLLVERKLEAMHNVYEHWKEKLGVFGGPAVVEIFGEKPFVPKTKDNACKLSEKQQKYAVEYMGKAGDLQNRYIKGEERSFTIIAFPIPDIGEQYETIFDEIVRINTLDYTLYRDIQQTIIDSLDRGSEVIIKGKGENRTDLRVRLHELSDPDRQTNFENCVADVNIPVGEVFTSPLLAGTDGILHVTRVFLNELEYRDFWLRFADGMVVDYGCANFDTQEENRKYIKDNVLFHHESLPVGEFAIGTNTTAYTVARKYGIEDKMPILIAEKTGPHFAVGDTCYSHSENVAVYNPDGKEIIARDNEVSLLRDTDPGKAYFQCHTDITIPYDELGELKAVTKSGEEIVIIRDGRFVLQGCEELNKALL